MFCPWSWVIVYFEALRSITMRNEKEDQTAVGTKIR